MKIQEKQRKKKQQLTGKEQHLSLPLPFTGINHHHHHESSSEQNCEGSLFPIYVLIFVKMVIYCLFSLVSTFCDWVRISLAFCKILAWLFLIFLQNIQSFLCRKSVWWNAFVKCCEKGIWALLICMSKGRKSGQSKASQSPRVHWWADPSQKLRDF